MRVQDTLGKGHWLCLLGPDLYCFGSATPGNTGFEETSRGHLCHLGTGHKVSLMFQQKELPLTCPRWYIWQWEGTTGLALAWGPLFSESYKTTICLDHYWVHRNKSSYENTGKNILNSPCKNCIKRHSSVKRETPAAQKSLTRLQRAEVERSYFAFSLKWSQESTGTSHWDLLQEAVFL